MLHPSTCSPSNILRSSTPALLRLRPPSLGVNRPRDRPLPQSPFPHLHDPSHQLPILNPPPPPLPSPRHHHRQPLPPILPLPLPSQRATSRLIILTPHPHLHLAPRPCLISTNTLRRIFFAFSQPSSSKSSMRTMSYQSLRPLPCPHKQLTLRWIVILTHPSGHPLPSHPA